MTGQKENTTLDLTDVVLSSLSEDQRFAFTIIIDKLLKYKENPTLVNQLQLLITGTAGSGKSYLI